MGERYITIGSKGTSIPPISATLAPLSVGLNSLRWAGRGRSEAAVFAHAWVSKNGEPFELYPLKEAVAHRRVQEVSNVSWTARGIKHTGDIYLPSDWSKQDELPMYVAAIANTWPHGRVETKLINNGRNKDFFGVLEFPTSKKAKTPRRGWTREELLVLLNIYHKLTFGQFDSRNPVIIDLAAKMGRGSNSVAMKLSNLASLDPALRLRGIRGLQGASSLDREMWKEFHANLEETVPASEEALRRAVGAAQCDQVNIVPRTGVQIRRRPPISETDSFAMVKQRRGQEYFRDAVLNNFGEKCGVSRLAVRELLVASHILPWSTHPAERLNVRNGICLSRLHDAAFDCGLISFDDSLRLILSPRLAGALDQRSVVENFGVYSGEPLQVPDDAAFPDLAFISEHRKHIFQSS